MNRWIRNTLALAAMAVGAVGATATFAAEKRSLTLSDARRAADAAVAEARKSAGTAAIAVVDDGGHVMLVERLDDTFAAGAGISIGKARTAALFKKPTKFFEDVVNKGRTAMTALPADVFTPLQGGVPIVVDGQVVGAIGVSGAASAANDEEIAIAGANAVASPSAAVASASPVVAARPVTFFNASSVMSAFARGAVLFDGSGGANFQVHASRRVEPGKAEVHTTETDIIYVLKGRAEFVTGGTAADLVETAAHEFRGSRIDGGEARVLQPGDVIVVPAGTPHWFKGVEGEFHYFVVKVS